MNIWRWFEKSFAPSYRCRNGHDFQSFGEAVSCPKCNDRYRTRADAFIAQRRWRNHRGEPTAFQEQARNWTWYKSSALSSSCRDFPREPVASAPLAKEASMTLEQVSARIAAIQPFAESDLWTGNNYYANEREEMARLVARGRQLTRQ